MNIYMEKYIDQGNLSSHIQVSAQLTCRLRRVQDWIYGVRSAEPSKETKKLLETEPLKEAEKQRILYQLITNPESEGGAGITPGENEWQCVERLCPLHDHTYNKQWIKKWSTSYLLSKEDLDDIRNRFGEKVSRRFPKIIFLI